MLIKEKIYLFLPHFFQNCLVTIYDFLAYRKRHSGVYNYYKRYYNQSESLSRKELEKEQERRFETFMKQTYSTSQFYKNKIDSAGININNFDLTSLNKISITTKEDLRTNINQICSDKKSKIVSHTGGTTGKSLTVYFSHQNAQERFACLDNFKSRFGWHFGAKTAWFSGKALLNRRDLRSNRYWKTDFLYNIRYYSTFHINEQTIQYYIQNLNLYQPLFFSGFPSSISEIARYGIKHNLRLNYQPIAIFPTAESITEVDKISMELFYNCQVCDQYASSEGAPFITQCKNGHMHLEPLSGIFEVLDDMGVPSESGELIVTPFATEATPLVRYKIGDSIELETEKLNCYLNYPIVKKINGRINDFIYSNETGKINLGNISNIVKYVKGVNRFQIIQNEESKIIVLIVCDHFFNNKNEKKLIKELRARVGDVIEIQICKVPEIKQEKSGKYRIVKNNLKF